MNDEIQEHWKTQLAIDLRDDFVEVRSNGVKSFDYSCFLMKRVLEFCRANEQYRILGISNSSTPFSQAEAVAHVRLWEELGVYPPFRIAWVEVNSSAYDSYELTETVLRLRRFPARLFDDVGSAKQWLLGAAA